MKIEDLCEECSAILSNDILFWKTIYNVIDNHDYPSSIAGATMHKDSE